MVGSPVAWSPAGTTGTGRSSRGAACRRARDGRVAAGTPLVLVGHELPGVPAPTVRADNHEGVRAAVALLAGHGHRRVAFAGFVGAGDIAERRDAYLDAVRTHGLDGGGDLVLEIADNHESGGVEAADRWLAGLDASAVVLGTDRNATGLLQRLRETGRTVPGDVAVG